MSIQDMSGLPLAGDLIADGFQGWPPHLLQEFQVNAFNGHVGQTLLSETDRVRVWEIRLAPGERVSAHRHVLDYFWTAVTDGRSRQHTHDGTTREVAYQAGDTRHFTFRSGQYLLHDLENTGPTTLIFTTVEFKDGPNHPLSLYS
ncbi:hypothetical protein OG226_50385 [Streptomyces sp. NBC_01261]|uniref:hypothetical protein n=1 Tax=Streptomyces sp. NBC_01261 TaxID=2903802 RepID=UPI002E3530CE|nr:hypothetical protein [Streptomyces sp. NBC_01261]